MKKIEPGFNESGRTHSRGCHHALRGHLTHRQFNTSKNPKVKKRWFRQRWQKFLFLFDGVCMFCSLNRILGHYPLRLFHNMATCFNKTAKATVFGGKLVIMKFFYPTAWRIKMLRVGPSGLCVSSSARGCSSLVDSVSNLPVAISSRTARVCAETRGPFPLWARSDGVGGKQPHPYFVIPSHKWDKHGSEPDTNVSIRWGLHRWVVPKKDEIFYIWDVEDLSG